MCGESASVCRGIPLGQRAPEGENPRGLLIACRHFAQRVGCSSLVATSRSAWAAYSTGLKLAVSDFASVRVSVRVLLVLLSLQELN